ncbi:MAG TPA: hypothetical protein VMD91_00570 [Candidatus Sulfotelmatobacter sp.]|nr:hypothetical protein [Candidatus Sulfotelmatobacter sp.]
MRSFWRRFSLTLSVIVLGWSAAGCGGGGSGLTPTGKPSGKGTALFRVSIPKKAATSGRSRVPAYVSPATQALSVAINGPTTIDETVALTPTFTGCSSTLASTQCTLQVSLAPGSYTATLSTYDGYDAGTQAATGNVLSTGQNLAFTILAGQTNSIALSLSGVPAQIVVTALSALAPATGTNAYDLVGPAAHAFLAQALDADGNIIVGPGSPTFTIAAPTGALAATAVQPTTTSPNQFSLVPPTTFGSDTATFGVSATYTGQATDGCAQSGAVCGPVDVTVDMVRALVVANCSACDGTSGPNNVEIYADGGSAPLVTLSGSSVGEPQNVVADAGGDLFVANQATDTVTVFAAPSFTKTTTIDFGGGLMAVAPNGTLYLGDTTNGDNMAAYAPPYTGAAQAAWNPIGFTGIANSLAGITVGPNGDLWIDDDYNSYVWKFSAPVTGSPSPAVTITSVSEPGSLALDPSGNLFVVNTQSYQIYKFAAPVTSGSTATTVNISPWVGAAIVSDAGGNIYEDAWSCCSGPYPSQMFLIPAGTTSPSAAIAISSNEPYYSGSAVSQLRSLGLGANGVYVNDLGTNTGEPNIQEFNFALTSKIATITTGITQPQALVVEP